MQQMHILCKLQGRAKTAPVPTQKLAAQVPSPPTSGTDGPSHWLNGALWCQNIVGSYLLSRDCISTPWSRARGQLTGKRRLHTHPRLVSLTCEEKCHHYKHKCYPQPTTRPHCCSRPGAEPVQGSQRSSSPSSPKAAAGLACTGTAGRRCSCMV